jgi:hypothetical protein
MSDEVGRREKTAELLAAKEESYRRLQEARTAYLIEMHWRLFATPGIPQVEV